MDNLNQQISEIVGTVTQGYLKYQNTMRPGQITFNGLADLRPDLAEKITGTSADPFYNDGNLEAFWDKVTEIISDEYVEYCEKQNNEG